MTAAGQSILVTPLLAFPSQTPSSLKNPGDQATCYGCLCLVAFQTNCYICLLHILLLRELPPHLPQKGKLECLWASDRKAVKVNRCLPIDL